jgi:HemY protein
MLWALLKVLIFIAIVAGLAYGVGFLTELDEVILVTIAGREFVLTPLVAILGALVLLFAVWLLFRIVGLIVATLRFLNGDETALSRHFNRRAERKGFEALAEGMMALAAGEGRLAIRKAERAQKYLNRPELTRLVMAQGAEMAGDRQLASETYKALVTDDRTRFTGIRGLMKQKLDAGDIDTAMKLAERALVLRPKNEEVQRTLLDLQVRHEDWSAARDTLAKALKAGTIPRDLHRRRDAVLALAHARDAMAEGKIEEATRSATEANRLAPTLVPAAVMAARLAIADKKPQVATKILKAAWKTEPHPDLAAAFAEIAPGETPDARLKRFRPLLNAHAGTSEAKLLEAELQIAREDFPAARRALGTLPETEPTKRSLTLMAAIERGEGSDDTLVRAWLAKALTASPGPQWICDVDGKAYREWTPVTDGGFDTLSWKTAPGTEVMSANAAGVLPMIVGALEDKGKAPVEEAEPVEEDGSAEAADKSDETSDKDEDTPGEGDETAAAEPRESAEARP